MARNATRRGVLASAALALPLLASGCSGITVLGTPPRPLPDVATARHAIASERDLIAHYTSVLAAMPALAAQLRPLLADHTDHLARLRGRLAGPQATAGPKAAGPAGGRPRVPPTQAAALAGLRTAEEAASASLLAQLQAASPSLAQLLASIAASEASHSLLLGLPGQHR